MGISLTSDSCKDKEADAVHPGRTGDLSNKEAENASHGFLGFLGVPVRRPFKERAHGRKYGGSKRIHDAVWRSTTDQEAPLRDCTHVNLGLYAPTLTRLNGERSTGKEDGFAPCTTGRTDIGITIAPVPC